MAKQLLNVGLVADDGTGDTIRSGAIKINENFSEVYELAVQMTATTGGLVPTPPNDREQALRGDGTWGYMHLFSQYAKQTVANTTVKSTLIGPGMGSVVLPANHFNHMGKMVELMMMGNWFKAAGGELTLLIEVINDGLTKEIHRKQYTSAQLGGASTTVGHWEIHMMMTAYMTGTTGSIMTHAGLSLLENTSAEKVGTHSETSEVQIDTTKTVELVVTAQWSIASPDLIISSSNVMLE